MQCKLHTYELVHASQHDMEVLYNKTCGAMQSAYLV